MPNTPARTAATIVLVSVIAATATGSAAAPDAKRVVVKRVTLTLVDESRPTPVNGDYAGAPNRTLETVVSFPKGTTKKRPVPLVLYATGIGGTATNYADMYDHWVQAGYMVAAPTFPLSSEDAPGGTSASDLSNQPADLSFVLDEMLRLNDERGSDLFGLVDVDHIGVIGKSLGALTVVDLTYNPSFHDDRFAAVVVLTGLATGGADFDAYNPPLLLVHGDADETVPYSSGQEAYTKAQSPKFFVTIAGATHSSAFHGADDPASIAVVKTVRDFLDSSLKNKKAALERLERDGNVDGVASLEASP
jgi:predicted dienelactone hydrolase